MSDETADAERRRVSWDRAVLAAQIFACDPAGLGGVDLRAPVGAVRDCWLDIVHALAATAPQRRIPASIEPGRLLGELDLGATLAGGVPVMSRGLLAEANDGLVIVSSAERLDPFIAAVVASVLERGAIVRGDAVEPQNARFGLVALDEGEGEERTPAALRERCAIALDLHEIAPRDAIVPPRTLDAQSILAARRRLSSVHVEGAFIEVFCEAAVALGITSLRPPLHAVHVARTVAALNGRDAVTDDDAKVAAALVLAPRATQLPASTEESPDMPDQSRDPDEDRPDEENPGEQSETRQLDDVIVDAARAAIPANLLARLAAGRALGRTNAGGGKGGAQGSGASRGRRLASRQGRPRDGVRLDLIATLRAAAPWQRLRNAGFGRIAVRPDDLRVARFLKRTPTSTIFLVDASGSAARERLAEAKGAIKLILADCYIRRDEVALIAFRGVGTDVLLAPTRSLVRADRALAALPGGGGTPIAAGLDAATALARGEQRRRRTPALLILSDGRANVARDGSGGRARAHAEALGAARAWRETGFKSLFIDTSIAPSSNAAAIAAEMDARYVPLPLADARAIESVVRMVSR